MSVSVNLLDFMHLDFIQYVYYDSMHLNQDSF